MPYPAKTGSVLLVEGQDDKHMVWQLCDQDPSFSASREDDEMWVTLRDRGSTFRILEKGNDSTLLKSIRDEVEVRRRPAVGIIMDADSDLEKRWGEISARFTRTEIDLPLSPKSAGTIVTPKQDYHPRIGIWLMPDNKSHGELEDFALRMIPSNDDVWELSQRYIDTIPCPSRKFQADKIDRAKLFAWLAARREPSRMGAAVGAGDLDSTVPICRDLLTWLTDLFH